MSNFLAVATVTSVLRNYLLQALPFEIPSATATAVRPDAAGGLPTVGVNIFLFQVSQNQAITQDDWPNRSSSGKLLHRPKIGINLHYLLSFYGEESRLEPQQVLGSVTHRLNAQPVLDRDFIRSTVGDAFFNYVANSDLADAFEQVKFTPQNLSLEEMTKLWSVFQDTSYTLSTAYVASVVMLETPTPTIRVLPVFQRNFGVVPFAKVKLTRALADGATPDLTILGAPIRVEGNGFDGTLAQVEIGGTFITTITVQSTETFLFTLASPELRAGFHSLRTRSSSGYVSNPLSFQLRPTITLGAVAGGMLPVNFSPVVGRRQRVELVLNQLGAAPGVDPISRVLPAPSENGIAIPTDTFTAQIQFPVAGIPAGNYLVRAVVDGAENLLERIWTGTDWEFISPLVVLV